MSTIPNAKPSERPRALADSLRELVDSGRIDEAVRQAERLTEAEVRAAPEVEIEVARALARSGRLSQAADHAAAALAGFRGHRNVRGQMRANAVLGGLHFEQGHGPEAERCFGVVRVLALALDDRRVLAQVTNNLACLALQRNDFHAAEALLESGLLLARELADLRAQADILHNLNTARRGTGELDAAREAGRQAVALAERMEDWSMVALALGGLAETGAWQDDPEAELLLDRALESARRAGDPVREAEVGRVRAALALRAGRYGEARQLAHAASLLAESQGASLLMAECDGIKAIAFKREGRMAEASALKDRAVNALRRLNAYLERAWLDREWAMAA